jgi:hypothetical protein
MPKDLIRELCLYAWVGPDQLDPFGSGEIGLKQARCPAGMIPIVATTEAKVTQDYLTEQMEMMANAYGQPIYLVRFAAVEVLRVYGKGETP